MAYLEIKYLNNKVSDTEREYIKENIPKRYDKSMKFMSDEAKISSLLAGILIYNNLGADERDLKYNKLNKPYIDNGLYFNISHSKDYIVFVKSDKKIGVDIELIDEKNMSIVDYAFSHDEKNYIMNSADNNTSVERLTKLWTIKESVFKASGVEERVEPKDIVVLDDRRVSFFDEEYNIYTLKRFDHIISIASISEYEGLSLVEDRVIR